MVLVDAQRHLYPNAPTSRKCDSTTLILSLALHSFGTQGPLLSQFDDFKDLSIDKDLILGLTGSMLDGEEKLGTIIG